MLGILTTIISAVAAVTKALGIVGMAIQGLKAIGNALVSLGKALGLIKPETQVEDLGDKALQSEYNPDDFDSYADYVKAVEDYELDPEKSKLTTEEKKIEKGLELATGVAVEKYNDLPMEDFCIAVGKNLDYFTEAKLGEIGKLIVKDDQNIKNILNYINGSEKNSNRIQSTIDMLVGVEKSVSPSISDREAYGKVFDLRK